MSNKLFTRHIELIEGIQRCVMCGKVLADYTNSASPDGFTPKGWPKGNVFVHGNISQTILPNGYIDCTQKKIRYVN